MKTKPNENKRNTASLYYYQSEGRNGLLDSLRVRLWNGPFCWWNGPFLLVEWTVLEGVGCDRRVVLLLPLGARGGVGWDGG